MMNFFIDVLAIAVVGGLYLLFRHFFPGYFQEKGKNLATKEDIGEITRIVKDVENELGVLTQNKISLITEERNAILAFFQSYHLWLNTCLDSSFNNRVDYNLDTTQNLINRSNLEQNVNLAFARLELFIDDLDLRILCNELIRETFKLQHIGNTALIELKRVNSHIKDILETVPKDQQVEQIDPFLKKQEELFINLSHDVHEKYKTFKHLKEELRLKSRAYLLQPSGN